MSVHWLLVVAAAVILAQGKMYQWLGLRAIRYSRHFDTQACFQGDEVHLVEVIANHKLLPLPWLRLESVIPGGLRFHSQANLDIVSGELFHNHRSLFSLMPYTKVTRRHRVTCIRRGCYDLKSAAMTCGDPFGLFVASRMFQFKESTRLLVYPERIPFEDIPLPSHSWLGNITVRRWIVDDPFLIAGVRAYQYGDPMNAVNWSATARVGALQVHRNDTTADHRIMVLLNTEITETMWGAVTIPERIEKGIAYAAAIVESCIAKGIDTGFGCNGPLLERPGESVRIGPAGGGAHLTDIYTAMAMLAIESTERFGDFLERELLSSTTRMDYVLLTSFVSERMERQFEQLRQNGNAIEVIPLTDDPLPRYATVDPTAEEAVGHTAEADRSQSQSEGGSDGNPLLRRAEGG